MECAIKARDCKEQPLNCPGIDVKYEPYPKGENIGNDAGDKSNKSDTNSNKNNSSGNVDNRGNSTNKLGGAVENKKPLASSLSHP